MIRSAALLAAVLSTATFALQQPADTALDQQPHWIWIEEATGDQEVVLVKTFELDAAPASARLTATCDNQMVVTLNGDRLGVHSTWEQVVSRDVAGSLRAGENTIEVRCTNEGGPAGLVLRLDLGDDRHVVSDGSWRAALAQRARRGSFDDATVLGPVGSEDLPWSGRITVEAFDAGGGEMTAADPREPQLARPAERIALPEGFVAELLYRVPNEVQGSWVSLANGPDGTLFASDQGGKGLFRIEPAAIGDAAAVTTVERLPVDVSGAQGMTWAFDSLYANVNGQGVWRIRDTDGDGEFDDAANIIPLGNGGEHGPHAVMPTLDGTGLYFIAGNHTLPPEFDGSRAPSNWDEDLLLPRLWDARGHARGRVAPGGWIARCDPDGSNIEIVSSGYRNQYDIAMDAEGELFTYDADMEWDLGSPWYRPTRVCHVTSGSEFGWRSGTGKWPVHYEDSLPPVLEIGPGSPTGVLFGTGAHFPARYQRALFVLDWTFGTIYAVHLEPDGASFEATKEDFAWSKPLAVNDAVIGADGAMYVTVGGRGSQSALYRIRYAGAESTEPVEVRAKSGEEARRTRRELEAFHGRVDADAVAAAWPHMDSGDRFIRFAARIAVENQPVETWRARALAEERPRAAVAAMVALARQGASEDLEPIVSRLLTLNPGRLEESTRLGALRAMGLAFARHGAPSSGLEARVLAELEPRLPSGSDAENLELVRLLVFLQSDEVVRRAMGLIRDGGDEPLPPWGELAKRNDTYGGPIAKMLADMPPTRGIGYALALRRADSGWTPELRREYFTFFQRAAEHPGGASYSGFLEDIREDAALGLTVEEERNYADLLGTSLLAALPENITPPEGPGRAWTHAEASELLGERLRGRDHAAGENLFHAASCSACHRFDGAGGAIGPDLTTVGNKFSVADVLLAILEPSAAISDQYASHVVADSDGRIAEGILVEDEDEVRVYEGDASAEPVVFDRDSITARRESKVSQMPAGLVDAMSAEELADLVAYLVSGGDPKAEFFREEEGSR